MIQRVLDMDDLNSFLQVSRDLVDSVARTDLYRSLFNSGMLLFADSAWTPEDLDAISNEPNGLVRALDTTKAENTEDKVLHRLQLLGHMNPGIKRYITQYLQRACI